MVCLSWEDVVTMYTAYAKKSGFDTRFATTKTWNGITTHRYIVCNKNGIPRNNSIDTMTVDHSSKRRKTNFKVTDCPACIRVRFLPRSQRWEIYKFIDHHNHGLVGVENKDLTRASRQLSFSQQELIHKMQTTGFGASITHRMQTALKGGQHLVAGNKADFKNWNRDIRCYIGDRDAQMLVDKMEGHMKHFDNFFFEAVIVGGELRSFFWADDVSRTNYNVFGDVLAFDATYGTNMYNMIFVPFTGVDHHKKCVTFGAALLYNETVESYTWLLEVFLRAHVKQPLLVLTDQDPALKQAVSLVFPESHHRLCMWHVTKKLPAKVCGDVLQNTDLRARIHKLVWNVFIKPTTFEDRWKCLINEFNLGDNKWLKDMFNIRDQWVPGYFRELPMCCLMKTTSRCESSNSFFKIFSSPGNTLLQFMSCFEMALNAQRFSQRELEYETTTTRPELQTRLAIERHASYVYTRTLFQDVQKEIVKSLYFCGRDRVEIGDGFEKYIITHNNKNNALLGEYTVTVTAPDDITCSCRGFTRIGYVCRHIFCVFRRLNIEEIPDRFLKQRWRINALPSKVFSIENRYGVDTDEKTKLRQEATTLFEACVDRIRGDIEKLTLFVDDLKKGKSKIFEEVPNEPSYNSKKAVIEDLLGQPQPESVTIMPPQGIRNKGCGTKRRLIGPGEKAIQKSQRPLRLCRTCKKWTNEHDSRNCIKWHAMMAQQASKTNGHQGASPSNLADFEDQEQYPTY